MNKIYLKILIGMVVLLWIIYFIQTLNISKYINTNTEGFTPKIRVLYRPYVRTINQGFENFVNNYGSKVIINKLRKWDIY